MEQALVPRDEIQFHLGEHHTLVGNDGRERHQVDAGGQEFGGFAAFELKG